MLWIALIIGLILLLFSEPKSARQGLGFLIILIVAGCWAFSLLYWTGSEVVAFCRGPIPGVIGEAILSIFKAICCGIYLILCLLFWMIVGPTVFMLIGFFFLFSKILK